MAIIQNPTTDQEAKIHASRGFGVNLQLAIISLLGFFDEVENQRSNLRQNMDIAETAFHRTSRLRIPPFYPQIRYNASFFPELPQVSEPTVIITANRESLVVDQAYEVVEGNQDSFVNSVPMTALIVSDAAPAYDSSQEDEDEANKVGLNMTLRDIANAETSIMLQAIKLTLSDSEAISKGVRIIDPESLDATDTNLKNSAEFLPETFNLRQDFGIRNINLGNTESSTFRSQLEYQLPYSSFGLIDFELIVEE